MIRTDEIQCARRLTALRQNQDASAGEPATELDRGFLGCGWSQRAGVVRRRRHTGAIPCHTGRWSPSQ
jgi:hypothetical protein